MPNDKNEPSKPDDPAERRTKRPTTIDLKATEIKSESEPEPAAPPTPSKPADASAAAASARTSASAASETREPPSPQPSGSSGGTVPPGDAPRVAFDTLPGDRPWALIAAAAIAAVVFFAIGLGAGHWFSRDAQQAAAGLETVSSARNAELSDRMSKLEAALAAPRAQDPQLLARIAAAEAAVKAATDMTATRDRRSDEIATIAREARERATSAASTAEAAQKTRAASSENSRADLDALSNRLSGLEQAARSNQVELARRANDSTDDAKSRLAIAALALRNAAESGEPFIAELSAVKSLSGDPKAIAALEPFAASGVPAANALGRELSAVMPSIWKAARASDAQEGTFLERLQANAEKVVRIRPAGDVAGDDPVNVKARLEMRAGSADIRGALAELSKLPPDARAPAEGWMKKAQARTAALAAARSLAQDALSALAKSGS